MVRGGVDSDLARAVATYLAFIVDKIAERGANVCRWDNSRETIVSPIANGNVSMVWDFPEANPFGDASGSWEQSAGDIVSALETLVTDRFPATVVRRGSALSLPYTDDYFEAKDAGKPVAFEPARLDTGATICIPNTVAIVRGTRTSGATTTVMRVPGHGTASQSQLGARQARL